jgi:endonuclease YncB( thermonuclease family)
LGKQPQRWRATLPLALIGLLLGTIVAVGYLAFSPPPAPQPAPPAPQSAGSPVPSVNRPTSGPQAIVGQASVIDGDTIEIHSTRIRLYGIDAPESDQTCRVKGEPFRCGQQAAFALADKIKGHTVECRPKDQDQYGRIVAKCFIGVEDINGWMVERGWALAYLQYSRDYVGQERNAANAKRGIWQGEFQVPWEWRRNQPGRRPISESYSSKSQRPTGPSVIYYRPGDLSGTRFQTRVECEQARQRAGNVGTCVMK